MKTIRIFSKHVIALRGISISVAMASMMLVVATSVFSQGVIISENPNDVVNPASLLEVKSDDKGLLIPRMTLAQRLAITLSEPAQGLMVFQTDSIFGYYYNISTTATPSWVKIYNGVLDPWRLGGNDLAAATANSFVGTKNNFPLNFKVFSQNAGRIDNTKHVATFGFVAGNSLTTGTDNVLVGDSAGFSVAFSKENTIAGSRAGRFNGSQTVFEGPAGDFNSFFGFRSGYSNAVGNRNSFFGHFSGVINTASNNSFFGASSGSLNSTGLGNSFFGNNAGNFNTTGNNITCIGRDADVTVNNLSNATAIGANAEVSASNSLVLGNNANVGIGTSSPTAKLEVFGSGTSNATIALRIRNSAGSSLLTARDDVKVGIGTFVPGATLDITSPGGASATITAFRIRNSPEGGTLLIVKNDGKVGINTISPDQKLSVSGNASKTGGGVWAAFSDRRVKKDIIEFKDGLDVIKQINPVGFRYNGLADYPDDGKQYVGVIAQDVQKIAPYMIEVKKKKLNDSDTEETDLLMYDGSALTYILVNAIKELNVKVVALEEELAQANKANKELEKMKAENASMKADLQKILQHLRMDDESDLPPFGADAEEKAENK